MKNRTEPLEDETWGLLERAQAGDQEAIERLFARYVPRLQRWARGRLPPWARDLTDTHDLVQDTLLRTFRRIDTIEYRGEGSLQAYLRQALFNRIREELRSSVRRPMSSELAQEPPDPRPSPLDRAIDERARRDYERALARLRGEDREAIVARVELGLSYEELATLQNRPTADAARKAAKRALARLLQEMDRD